MEELRLRDDLPKQPPTAPLVNPIELFLKRENIYPKTADIEI